MNTCLRLLAISAVALLICSRVAHARYLPTRDDHSSTSSLENILQAIAAKNAETAEAGEAVPLADDGSEEMEEQKRFNYMYLCFDRRGKYHMCYKSYRRRK